MTEITKDRDFLKDLNHQLELNQAELQRRCKRLEDVSRITIAKKDEEVKDLQEQVRAPMLIYRLAFYYNSTMGTTRCNGRTRNLLSCQHVYCKLLTF